MKIPPSIGGSTTTGWRPIREVTPIEEGLRELAVNSLVEKRRIERTRVTVRTDRLRTAELFFEHDEEDYIHQCLSIFSRSCSRAMRELTPHGGGLPLVHRPLGRIEEYVSQ